MSRQPFFEKSKALHPPAPSRRIGNDLVKIFYLALELLSIDGLIGLIETGAKSELA
jgi:hypothetical protein